MEIDRPGATKVVLLSGVTVSVKVAHVRLCHSRMLFVRAYPRETQEMVFDAHDQAFVLFNHLRARHLRQHEDGSGDGLRWQGPALQSPLPADVQPLSGRASCLTGASGSSASHFDARRRRRITARSSRLLSASS
jgi:hypothetical protein